MSVTPVLRNVSITISVNYVSGIPASLTVNCSGLAPSATLKVLINGTQASTIPLDATGSAIKAVTPNAILLAPIKALYPPPSATPTLTGSVGIYSGSFLVDNLVGRIAAVGCGNGTTSILIEVSY